MQDTYSDNTQGELISRTTILILSGILIVASAVPDLDPFGFCIFAAGVTGLIAFISLDLIVPQAIAKRIQPEIQRSIEQRLERHLVLPTAVPEETILEQHKLLEWLERETRDLHR